MCLEFRKLVRLEDSQAGGLARRSVLGLNALEYNAVEVHAEQDPRVVFLARCATHAVGSVVIGGLSVTDRISDPVGLFGKLKFETPLGGLNGGRFYSLTRYPDGPAYLFHNVDPSFFGTLSRRRKENDLMTLIHDDALALLLSDGAPDVGAIRASVESGSVDEFDYLRDLASCCGVIILTSGDGQFFEVYAQDFGNFTLIEGPLNDAIDVIANTKWYKQNEDRLAWDDVGCCLMVADASI
jgi:hypothetical protein